MTGRKKTGFTLIELMIVIVILGILLVMGTFAFSSSQRRGRDSKRKGDLAQIAKALEMYANDMGTVAYNQSVYPSHTANGEINACNGAACAWGKPFQNGTTIYMAQLPRDPASDYTYAYQRTGNGYILYASLENPQDSDLTSAPSVLCGRSLCNYMLRSANITPVP